MSETRNAIDTLRAEIATKQVQIAALQTQCSHKMTVVSQVQWQRDFASTSVNLKCSECDLEETRNCRHPVCPKHACLMIPGTDEKSRELAQEKQKEITDPHSYYAPFPFKCPHEDCEERIVLVLWDR